MKESITKFDLEAAFKALDEIDIPQVKGLRPNKMNLSEATNRVDRTSMLIEDYYNLNSQEDLQEATEDREAEVAKAKLARIEKIVDLNAETEDDILPSYVGKIIIQCPECMTLFYKDEADIQKSDEDPTTVNVGEVCQHCGNDAGYMLIGKVAEETPEDLSTETTEEETVETEELPELSDEESTENTKEENNSEGELPDLEELPLPDEEENKEENEEEKNESLNNSKLLKDIKKKNELASENTSENLTLNEETELQEITSTYDFIIYAVDKNGDTVIKKDFHGRVKDAKAEMQAILDNDSEENITDVFISRKNGQEEIPIDHLTLSRYDSFDDATFDARHNLASESLKEDLDTDMSKYNAYIDYIQSQIKADEEELKKAGDNQLIKDAIQKKLDAHKADLESALPPVVKDVQAEDELPTPEEVEKTEEISEDKKEANESLNKSKKTIKESYNFKSDKEYEILLTDGTSFIADGDKAEDIAYDADDFKRTDVSMITELNSDGSLGKTMWTDEESFDVSESLNKSKLLKDIKKKNELASENISKNTTLNEDVDPIKVDLDDFETAISTPGVWGVEEIGDDCRLFATEAEARNYFDSFNLDDLSNDCEGIELFVVNDKGVPDTVDSKIKDEYCDYDETLKKTKTEACKKCGKEICECDKALTEDEDISLTYSDEAIEDMFNSKEFKTPISDEEVEDYIEDDKAAEDLKNVEDIQEASFNRHISDYLAEVYSNVDKFEMTNCQLDSSKLVIEGIINFKSGTTKETSFTFRPRANKILEGYNKDITESTNAFKISYSNEDIEGCGNTLITESIEYNYSADNTVVKGKK